MQIRPTAFTIGLIMHFSIALFCVYTELGIDFNTPQGRFVLSIFAALSELEREQTLQRQRESIAISKSKRNTKEDNLYLIELEA